MGLGSITARFGVSIKEYSENLQVITSAVVGQLTKTGTTSQEHQIHDWYATHQFPTPLVAKASDFAYALPGASLISSMKIGAVGWSG